MRSSKLVAMAAFAIVAVAACGGSSAAPTAATQPTSAPAGVTATPAPTAAPTAAPAGGAATPAPTAAPTAAPGTAAPTTAAAPAGKVDPCTLLTPADLKTVTGQDYGAGAYDGYSACVWDSPGAKANTGNAIAASVPDQTLATIKSAFAGGIDVTVSGHAAYWNPGQGLQTIWVDFGARTLAVTFLSSRTLGPDDQVVAQKLAEIAVGKM